MRHQMRKYSFEEVAWMFEQHYEDDVGWEDNGACLSRYDWEDDDYGQRRNRIRKIRERNFDEWN